MARSSRGPRAVSAGPAEQRRKPIPRIVRLGRPANDNYRSLGPMAQAIAILTAALVVLGLVHWVI